MTDILTTQVTELLTTYLGRAPTSAELTNGLISPITLAQIQKDLNVGQSIFSVAPGDDLQAAITKLNANGGGVLNLQPGTFNLVNDLVVSSNTRIQGVGSGGSIIDFGGGAHAIRVEGTSGSHVTSVFLQGFEVTNSSTNLIRVKYADNFGGYDIRSSSGLSGIKLDNVDTLNWSVGFVESCGTGMIMNNMTGMTIANTFLTNITSGGGYVATNCTNSVIFNSSLDTVVGGGYKMTGCTNFGVEQVSILNVTGIGFLIDGGGTSFSLTQGLIQNCSSDGLQLKSNASQVQVCGAMQFSSNGGYGINITAGCTNNQIAANSFYSNSSGAAHDLGTTTLIRSNVGLADN